MKVQINHTLMVEDDELVQLADVIDGKVTKRKAKRDEVKDYVWAHGRDWARDLTDDHAALFGADEASDDDLIGSVEEDLEALL